MIVKFEITTLRFEKFQSFIQNKKKKVKLASKNNFLDKFSREFKKRLFSYSKSAPSNLLNVKCHVKQKQSEFGIKNALSGYF